MYSEATVLYKETETYNKILIILQAKVSTKIELFSLFFIKPNVFQVKCRPP
jgi:hypothetical protein